MSHAVVDALAARYRERKISHPKLKAQLVWDHVEGAEPGLALGELADRCHSLADRILTSGVATERVLGGTRFFGRWFEVAGGVIVPDRASETAARLAAAAIAPAQAGTVVDVGCGAGTIAITIAAERPFVEVWALDTNPRAVALTRRNAARCRVGERVHAFKSDVFSALPEGFVADVVVSNPPSVPWGLVDHIPNYVRRDTPDESIFAASDGLAVFDSIVRGTRERLRSGGALILEYTDHVASGLFALVNRSPWIEPVRNLRSELEWGHVAVLRRVTAA